MLNKPKIKSIFQIIAGIIVLILIIPIFIDGLSNLSFSGGLEMVGYIFGEILFLILIIIIVKKIYKEIQFLTKKVNKIENAISETDIKNTPIADKSTTTPITSKPTIKKMKIIYGLVILAILGFVFYWFQWRPNKIRKECQRYSSMPSLKGVGIPNAPIDTRTAEERYKDCLRQNGLTESSTEVNISQPSNTSQPSDEETTPQPSQTLSQELLNELMRRVVKITCSGSIYTNTGFGIIAISDENDTTWGVITNTHVVLADTPDKTTCTVGLPTPPNYSISQYFSVNLITAARPYPTIDGAFLYVKNGLTGFKHLSNEIMPWCKRADVKIGDKVNLFGYPSYGGSSLTMTDGIVSGVETTQYGPIYKTSAKIDSGNSGGLAIDVNSKCTLGMLTWGVVGTFEGLGYIQSFEMIMASGGF